MRAKKHVDDVPSPADEPLYESVAQTIRRVCALALLAVSAAFLAGYAVGAVETIAHTLEVLVR
jgi:ABC-type nitrate/sulfonate/bicarbonate transport system permease component